MSIRIRTRDKWSQSCNSTSSGYGVLFTTIDGVLRMQKMADPALMRIGLNIVRRHFRKTQEEPVDEKEMESRLYETIRAGESDRAQLASLTLHRSTSNAQSLGDLLGAAPYELIQDHSRWNLYPKLMIELTGG